MTGPRFLSFTFTGCHINRADLCSRIDVACAPSTHCAVEEDALISATLHGHIQGIFWVRYKSIPDDGACGVMLIITKIYFHLSLLFFKKKSKHLGYSEPFTMEANGANLLKQALF